MSTQFACAVYSGCHTAFYFLNIAIQYSTVYVKRGIILLSIPGTVYGLVIMKRIKGKIESKTAEEQRGLRKPGMCRPSIYIEAYK